MSRLVKLFSAAALTLGLSSAAQAATYSFSTADNPIYAGSFNQGWWDANDMSDPSPGSNDSVFTGENANGIEQRSFFTFNLFDLNLAANEEITSVTFGGNANGVSISGGAYEALGLYEVIIGPGFVNQPFGNTSGVFEDLGNGLAYGSRDFFSADENSDFEIALNAFAFAEILDSQGGYFTMGAALLTLNSEDPEYLFAGSSGVPFTLNIETQISAVPLPAALPLYGAGLAVMGFIGWRKQRNRGA